MIYRIVDRTHIYIIGRSHIYNIIIMTIHQNVTYKEFT